MAQRGTRLVSTLGSAVFTSSWRNALRTGSRTTTSSPNPLPPFPPPSDLSGSLGEQMPKKYVIDSRSHRSVRAGSG